MIFQHTWQQVHSDHEADHRKDYMANMDYWDDLMLRPANLYTAWVLTFELVERMEVA